MQSGILFRRIVQPDLRKRIESKILETSGVIPSIRTFHKNMKYLSIATDIIKTNITGQLKPHQSIDEAMYTLWLRNRPVQCFLEVKEDDFRELHCRPTPKFAYQQLIIAALRLFSSLTQNSPRCETGSTADYSWPGYLLPSEFPQEGSALAVQLKRRRVGNGEGAEHWHYSQTTRPLQQIARH